MDRFRQRRFKHITALLLLAFFVKMLVPAGFMPGKTADGATEIVICTGHGPVTKTVGPDRVPAQQEEEKKQAPSCPYAPVMAQGFAGSAPAIAPVLIYNVPVLAAAELFIQNAAPKSWFAQGPPAFS